MKNKHAPRVRKLTVREEQLTKRKRRIKDAMARASRKANR